jgi:hypothetical protein
MEPAIKPLIRPGPRLAEAYFIILNIMEPNEAVKR